MQTGAKTFYVPATYLGLVQEEQLILCNSSHRLTVPTAAISSSPLWEKENILCDMAALALV